MSVTNQQPKSHLARKLTVLVAVIASFAVVLFVALNRQYVIDQVAFWQFNPTGAVASITTRTGMSDTGKFYFYASSPSIENAAVFNDKCARKEEATAILGCYTGQKIYMYNVTNQQLDGIREVTAAHEMLHAAYDRLGVDEKNRVNALIEIEYETLKNNSEFAERMAFYARTEPGERDNELHSIIGTEVGSIGGELEAHYKRYFTDRSRVVALHTAYAAVFDRLNARAKEITDELTSLADTINRETAQYNADVVALNGDIAAFNQRASSGGFTSSSEFQAERSALASRANALEVVHTSINAKIDRYNTLRTELAGIASQSEVLNKSIDSTLAPAPSV